MELWCVVVMETSKQASTSSMVSDDLKLPIVMHPECILGAAMHAIG